MCMGVYDSKNLYTVNPKKVAFTNLSYKSQNTRPKCIMGWFYELGFWIIDSCDSTVFVIKHCVVIIRTYVRCVRCCILDVVNCILDLWRITFFELAVYI